MSIEAFVKYSIGALACISITLYPTFVAIPGENLWSLMDQVGLELNDPFSKIVVLSSLNDIYGSKIELIGSVSDEINLDVFGFASRIESLQESLCSQIDIIQSDIGTWASVLDALDQGILSVSDVLIEAVSESSVLLFL